MDVHDLHVWGLNSSRHVLSAHITSNDPMLSLKKATRLVNVKYKILHSTIQVERSDETYEEKKKHRFKCNNHH